MEAWKENIVIVIIVSVNTVMEKKAMDTRDVPSITRND